MSEQLFYLQDSRGLVGDNLMFWSPAGGYTSDINKARCFSKADAIAQHHIRESDIPWPAEYIQSRFYVAVDMQYLRNVDCNNIDTAFYRQLPGKYIGNDVLWVTDAGTSTDLRLARVFSSLVPGYEMWPVEEINKISRHAVKASDVSIKEALRGTGVKLQKPKLANLELFKCHHCGRFLSERQRFDDCPNCGGENRP